MVMNITFHMLLFHCSSQPYFEVYGNLYYLIAQAEETSATDKYAGFVLRKEGEEFVEQSANIFKYDLLYNPLRFESWQKLANIYDEVGRNLLWRLAIMFLFIGCSHGILVLISLEYVCLKLGSGFIAQ